MKIKLKEERSKFVGNGRMICWTKAQPFFINPNGLLIHRVETVTTYIYGKRKHTAVTYLCNGSTCTEGEFLAKPTPNRLVCAACERMAARKGKPSAGKLSGRHVHVGGIRVVQTCCRESIESN